MGNLVIVESPAKAGTIQKFLGKDYVVKSSYGHIRDLSDNNLSIDIENGFKPEYVIPSDKKKVVEDLKKAAGKASVVWLASDEDREGEAISWHLYETLGLQKGNTRRIVFHEITKNAILNAIENPRDINMSLVDAQQARRILDRLVGFELSPVLWRKVQPKLSAGRVQSVALRLIVDREKEIIGFQKEMYYKIEALFHPESTKKGLLVKAALDKKFPNIDEARKFLENCIGADFRITGIDRKEGRRSPAAPFTTSTLQQEAASKLKFPVSRTMNLAQKLYEAGYITYMRTDSTNLSSLAINTSKKFILEHFGEEYLQTRQYKTKAKGAQEAHEAIRPTYIENTEIPGTEQEKKLYNLIWKRTVASQMADAKVMRTVIKTGCGKFADEFTAQASQISFDGFMKVYMANGEDSENGETILPELPVGEKMEDVEINALCKFTAPPARYSDGTLVNKLEELGIGRPATYSATIDTLTKGRGYVITGDKAGENIPVTNLSLKNGSISETRKTETVGAEKGRLLPQEIGMIVSDYLVTHFSKILDYGFTADVEKDFDQIAAGKKEWNEVIAAFYGPFHENVENTLNAKDYGKASKDLGIDPSDGQPVIAKFGQYGAYVQKGEGENRKFASLAPGQLIESLTLEDALKLFSLPRTVGSYNGIDIVCTKGKFGPYLKYGDRNISLPRGTDPVSVSLEKCIEIIEQAAVKPEKTVLAEFPDSDIQVLAGRYGPYIKHAGSNYKIPKGTDPSTLTEEQCKDIVAGSEPTDKKKRKK